ncbi:MAG: glycosyltransferase family 39 protein [Chitinispirillaceae bacterium]|nr:glycosyltransferase family 39 protein [Chitinispirillaceae bacterium]
MERTGTFSSEQARPGRFAVWLLLCLVLALRLAAAFFIPFGQTVEHGLEGLNDEPAHFNYVKYLVQHRAFPVLEHTIKEPDAFIRNEFEYFQSPLYYLICAPFCAAAGGGALAACRMISLVFGIACLWVIALILRDCGFRPRVQLAAALFAGLLPSHLYFSVLVSNDSLSWLVALLLTRALLSYERTGGNRHAAAAAVFLALGALTKGSLLIFFPAAAGVFIYKFIVSRSPSHLVRGSIVLAISGAAAMPWYVRNIILYHSLLGTPSSSGEALCTLQGLYGFLKATDKYFWFPMQHLEGGTFAYFCLCALGGGVIAFHAILAVLYIVKENRRSFCAAALFLFLLFNLAAYGWYFFFTEWGNPEARFLFPALASIVFFFIVPAHGFFVRLKIERLFLPYVLAISLFPYPFLFIAG